MTRKLTHTFTETFGEVYRAYINYVSLVESENDDDANDNIGEKIKSLEEEIYLALLEDLQDLGLCSNSYDLYMLVREFPHCFIGVRGQVMLQRIESLSFKEKTVH